MTYRNKIGQFISGNSKVRSFLTGFKITVTTLLLIEFFNGVIAGSEVVTNKVGWIEHISFASTVEEITPPQQQINDTVKASYKTTQQVQDLIDQLTTQEYNTTVFSAETARQEEVLHQERINAAIENALIVVKTQYDINLVKVTTPIK